MNEIATRLGRVEQAILQELGRSGGLTQRDAVVDAAFPASVRRAGLSPATARALRARAEAAVSRAILTLERKGLLVRERNPRTGRTALRGADQPSLPVWELLARAEEDLAVHCRRNAAGWQGLAGRARRRAQTIRRERSTSNSDQEREDDLQLMRRLEGSPP
ncbi:MAG: hypothetical protein M3019_03840 [Candidatus Dormibacteraeota bacterium]|nr:hypothetical protein [Candidatus Dormibacteraeota bacterium]